MSDRPSQNPDDVDPLNASVDPTSAGETAAKNEAPEASENGSGLETAAESEQPVAGEPSAEDEEELSLEDLGAAFAKAAAKLDAEAPDGTEPEGKEPEGTEPTEAADDAEPEAEVDEATAASVTPEAIVEAALFVGHPENQAFSPERLASLMRGVTADEVVGMIDELNQSYRECGQALRVVQDDRGYRLSTSPELESLRHSFLGKVRETRLSQLAVEVLSLVAYQPGIDANTVRDQRGRDCGSVLSQLVRRRLLEMRREKREGDSRPTARYYPTERFLTLFGLDSLEDLPQVDQTDASG